LVLSFEVGLKIAVSRRQHTLRRPDARRRPSRKPIHEGQGPFLEVIARHDAIHKTKLQ